MTAAGGFEASMNESRCLSFVTDDLRAGAGCRKDGFAWSGIFISTCLGTERALFGRVSWLLVGSEDTGDPLPLEMYDEKDPDPKSEGVEGT